MASSKTDLQLRISNSTVNAIDDMIGTVGPLGGFNRCKFIRYAVRYALDSIATETDQEIGS